MPSRGGLEEGGGEEDAPPRSQPQRAIKERQRQENSFVRIHDRRIVVQYNIAFTWTIL
jgi:hypothetical protein